MSSYKKQVQNGIFYAEVNDFLKKFFQNCAKENRKKSYGYEGFQIKNTPSIRNQATELIELIIRVKNSVDVVGEKGRNIKELQSTLQKRFNKRFEVFVERVSYDEFGLSPKLQCEDLIQRICNDREIRKESTKTLRRIMNTGAKSCEIIVAGKIRGSRARRIRFTSGEYLKYSGNEKDEYVKSYQVSKQLRQGSIGVKISIMTKIEK